MRGGRRRRGVGSGQARAEPRCRARGHTLRGHPKFCREQRSVPWRRALGAAGVRSDLYAPSSCCYIVAPTATLRRRGLLHITRSKTGRPKCPRGRATWSGGRWQSGFRRDFVRVVPRGRAPPPRRQCGGARRAERGRECEIHDLTEPLHQQRAPPLAGCVLGAGQQKGEDRVGSPLGARAPAGPHRTAGWEARECRRRRCGAW